MRIAKSASGPPDAPELLAAIREGLKEAGFVGQNVTIEYRFAQLLPFVV
jgi:hypothetical protein